MLICIKCFTCNKTLADKYDYYLRAVEQLKIDLKKAPAAADQGAGPSRKKKPGKALVQIPEAEGNSESASMVAVNAAKDSIYFDVVKTGPILDKMGLSRYCCRRHMLGTVDMMETI
jgi:DNA-directed RNA polymerase subunit N (RpoN/RPB10)